jgi:hypothetical protein
MLRQSIFLCFAGNSIFGKLLFNELKQKNFKLATDLETFERNAKELTVRQIRLLGDNVALFEHQRKEVTLAFPSIVGPTVLDEAKRLATLALQRIKHHIPSALTLLHDTDSYVFMAKGPEFHDQFATFAREMISSTELGRFKIETPANSHIVEFVGLRPKLYSILLSNAESIRRAKGVVRARMIEVQHERYVHALREGCMFHVEQTTINNVGFIPYTIRRRRRALTLLDTKRHLVDSCRSLPFGYSGTAPLPPLEYFNADLLRPRPFEEET